MAAQTGSARGFCFFFNVTATTEILVGAWAGAVDGAPTQGIVGMDAAAPIVRDALLAVAGGARLTLPKRPPGIEDVVVCETSGMAPSETCPRIHDYAHAVHARIDVDTWHDPKTGAITYPPRAAGWLSRQAGRHAKR